MADVIVLCTSVEKSDDALESIAKENNIEVFRGSLNDVLERFLGAAQKFNVDYFVVFSGDNIFCDPELMDLGLNQMINNGLDFIKLPPDLENGGVAYCISTKALERACRLKKDEDTEYYPKFFTAHKEFKVGDLEVEDPIFHDTGIRATIDYPEDIEFAKAVFEEFQTDTNNIPLRKIIELIREKPEIGQINFSRNKDWSKNQKPMKVIK